MLQDKIQFFQNLVSLYVCLSLRKCIAYGEYKETKFWKNCILSCNIYRVEYSECVEAKRQMSIIWSYKCLLNVFETKQYTVLICMPHSHVSILFFKVFAYLE
jgi:hypothetical protein